MAFTGRPALEAVDENTGLDAWAAKALDGLALTPTPAVQQEVSQDPFTGSREDAESPTRVTQHAGCSRVVFMGEGLPRWRPPGTSPLLSALQHALNPERTDFDAELRRAWLRLGRKTRRKIHNHCIGFACVDNFAQLRSKIMSLAPSASMPRTIAEEAPLEDACDAAPRDDDLLRETDAASETPEVTAAAPAPLDDDLLREIAFDDGRRPRQADEASEVSGVTVSSRATAATFASRATSAYTAVPTAHGATRMQQRAVALRDLQAAKKYGTITRAHDGVRGDKRWKIEYGGLVYITDEQQKFVITTYQIQPRADSLYIGPAPPPPTYPPPIYMPPAPILTPIVEGPIPLFQPPPPPMILRSTAWPVEPPMEVMICAACGKSLPEAAFTKRQWRAHSFRRCTVCILAGRAVPAEVKAAVESRISSRRRRGLPLTPLTYDGVTRSSILVNNNFY